MFEIMILYPLFILNYDCTDMLKLHILYDHCITELTP